MSIINDCKEKYEQLSEKVRTLPSKTMPVILIAVIVIGMLSSIPLYLAEFTEYNNYSFNYTSHEHSMDCKDLICFEDVHVHSALCLNCGLSKYRWHEHTDSCYCSKTEHIHEEECYIDTCEYSHYLTRFDYADAKTSYLVPNFIMLISLSLVAFGMWLTRSSSESAEKIYEVLENNKENFFNEKSNLWILKLKNWTIIIFVLEMVGAIIFGLVDSIGEVTVIGNELEQMAFLVWTFVGSIIAFLTRNINMIVLQFLNNINMIREKTAGDLIVTEISQESELTAESTEEEIEETVETAEEEPVEENCEETEEEPEEDEETEE